MWRLKMAEKDITKKAVIPKCGRSGTAITIDPPSRTLSLSLFLFVFRLEMYSPFLMLRFLNSFAFFGETIRVSDYILSVFVWKLFLVLVSLVVQVVLKREIMAYIFENL